MHTTLLSTGKETSGKVGKEVKIKEKARILQVYAAHKSVI
jgi:hypothetical protein